MRVLLDYRSALRERSGVGEYAHNLARALTDRFAPGDVALTLFSSSWKDRLSCAPELAGASTVDRRVPVKLLNFAWHRLGWPPAEVIAGRFDVTHALHPLMVPARHAARVVTIHDLNFLANPERTRAEIRRDYPTLAQRHAREADGVIVVSQFTAREVQRRLDVPAEKISICPPGAPDWTVRSTPPKDDSYILFLGTLEPRKNIGGLLDGYERLVTRRRDVPKLVLAGGAGPEATPWLERIARTPLSGHVEHIGYIKPADRRNLYVGARFLVQPSFEEGFGLPVLEAMTLGVPVVAADAGALPEVVADAGLLVDPHDPDSIAAGIERMLTDSAVASAVAARGVLRARQFRWSHTAETVYDAYGKAIERRCASA